LSSEGAKRLAMLSESAASARPVHRNIDEGIASPDASLHERSWDSTEQLTAKTWVFVGYSLSGADYESSFCTSAFN